MERLRGTGKPLGADRVLELVRRSTDRGARHSRPCPLRVLFFSYERPHTSLAYRTPNEYLVVLEAAWSPVPKVLSRHTGLTMIPAPVALPSAGRCTVIWGRSMSDSPKAQGARFDQMGLKEVPAMPQRRNRVQWVYAAKNNQELETRYDQWAPEYDKDLAEQFEDEGGFRETLADLEAAERTMVPGRAFRAVPAVTERRTRSGSSYLGLPGDGLVRVGGQIQAGHLTVPVQAGGTGLQSTHSGTLQTDSAGDAIVSLPGATP